MKFFLILHITLCMVFPKVEECGIVKIPMVWTKKNSPYIITNDLYVPPLSKLTIEAGTTIQFTVPSPCSEKLVKNLDWADSQYTSLKIEGIFYVNGTEKDPVTFMGSSNTKGSITWDGVRILKGTRKTIEIKHSIFRGANKAIQSGNTEFSISNSTFEWNNTGIELSNYGNIFIFNNNFIRNHSAGIYVYGASPHIINNIFAFNQNYGIWSDSRMGVKIEYNGFWKNWEGHCYKCPANVLNFIEVNKNGDSLDFNFNLVGDPVFVGSNSFKKHNKKDLDVDTDINMVKDKNLGKKSKSLQDSLRIFQGRKDFVPIGTGKYLLSKYSAFIDGGHPDEKFFDRDNTVNDIGIHGGPR